MPRLVWHRRSSVMNAALGTQGDLPLYLPPPPAWYGGGSVEDDSISMASCRLPIEMVVRKLSERPIIVVPEDFQQLYGSTAVG
jgi:hypothetical protein